MVCTHKLLSLSSTVTYLHTHANEDPRSAALPFSTLTHPSVFVMAIFNPVVLAEREVVYLCRSDVS